MYNLSELFFYKAVFVLEILLSMHLFSFHYKKRSHYALRVSLSAFFCLALSFALPILVYNSLYISALFLVLFLACGGSLFFIYDVSWRYIVFASVTAYTVQHFSHEAYGLIVTAVGFVSSATLGLYGNDGLDNLFTLVNLWRFLIYLDVYLLFYYLAYKIFAKKLNTEGIEITSSSLLILSALLLLSDVFLSAFTMFIEEGYSKIYSLICAGYNLLSCLMIFYIQYTLISAQQAEKELQITQQLLHKSKEQYQITRQNIELINIKCHDLKHQLRLYSEKASLPKENIDELESMISIYDATIKTGNEAIDVILSEKSLLCSSQKIKLSCFADCRQLSFIKNSDLYSLFGNILDNAIEAVSKIEDVEKRSISILVKAAGAFIAINVENYYEGNIAFDANNLPITSKAQNGYHGFGSKSIKLIVEKYQGSLSIQTQKNIFALSILFPIPSAK